MDAYHWGEIDDLPSFQCFFHREYKWQRYVDFFIKCLRNDKGQDAV